MVMRLPRNPAILLLAILVLCSGVFFLTRGGEGKASAGTAQTAPAEANHGDKASSMKATTEPLRSVATLETEGQSQPSTTDSTAPSLILRFTACSHAPTAVWLLSRGDRQAATVVDARTWSLPWLAARDAAAAVEIEFGKSVQLVLSELKQMELEIAMPPLADLTATFRDANVGWAADWTPESADGVLHADIATPIAIAGATASLHLRSSDHQAPTRFERASLLAPVGSSWTVYVSSPGMQVESPARHHVQVPAALEFTGRRWVGVRVVGFLPKSTLLLVYDDTDMSTPCRQARVQNAEAESTTIENRGAPLAPHAPHHLECLLPDGQRSSAPFETDAVGAAQVVIAGLRFESPTIIQLSAEHEFHRLYLRSNDLWQTIPSDPGDFHRENGMLLFIDTEAGALRLVHSRVAWSDGFVVSAAGEVARIRPTLSGPIVPDWFAGKAAGFNTAHLPSTAATVAWRLYFAADGVGGESTWLEIAAGSGTVTELESKRLRDMPALRLKLWTKALDGADQGTTAELESPFR